MKFKGTILLVEDEQHIREGLSRLFRRAGYEVIEAQNGPDALELAQSEEVHILLTDLMVPGFDGFELLKRVKEVRPEIQIIVITAFGTVERAVEAMRMGAYDFLLKPLDLKRLRAVVDKAFEKQILILENKELHARLGTRFGLEQIVGRSGPMVQVIELIQQVAPRRTTVLITGDSGTGKELVANAIHQLSPRSAKTFIKINCSALNEGVLESELFGHEKGSFTGAIARRPGRFELAHGGTIFLDEIGELTPRLQVKLLRVLQEKEFERVGGTETIKVDTRIIAATNSDLEDSVKRKEFREDLYYRLNVVRIKLPSLGERKSDIPFLVDFFIQKYNKENDTNIKGLARKAMSLLMQYQWPGNVRELENCLESAFVNTVNGIVTAESLPNYVQTGDDSDNVVRIPVGTSMKAAEEIMIRRTLESAGGNRTKAAEMLGVAVRTIHRKIEEFGL